MKSIMSTKQDNYVRCHQGVQQVCSRSLPSIQHVLETWHRTLQQTLSPCASPQTCPTKGKPKASKGSCQACIDWGDAVERALYNVPNSPSPSLQWSNINPTLLHHDHIEAAKAFVLRLQPGQAHKSIGDFGAASLLMIMMRFKSFHGGDPVKYNLIKKVSEIRNYLSHMKVDNRLSIDDVMTDTYFSDLHDLVVCLQGLYPQHFTQAITQEVLQELQDIRVSPVTQKIKDEVLAPFSAAMEQVVRETIQDVLTSQTEMLTRQVIASKFSLPANWIPMNPGQNSLAVKLLPTSKEYTDVVATFQGSIGRAVTVIEIKRIQNEELLKQYRAKKVRLDASVKPGVQVEREVYHGTSGDNCDKINTNGFNRSFHGVSNGTALGKGTYFARDASYSNGYAKPTPPNRYQYMYLCKVLAGEYTIGNNTMIAPPAKPNKPAENYDSVVDTHPNPAVFVVFHDAQALPEYLIVYQ